jgi:hypothetical protein
MTALRFVLTSAGRAALIDAEAGGTAAVLIAQAGFSNNVMVAAPTLTALPGEFKRVATVAGTAADAKTLHLVIRDESSDDYSVRAIGLYLDDGTLFAVYAQPDPICEKAEVTVFYLAADMIFADGDAASIVFGDTNFINPPATEAMQGVAYLATIAEALAGAVANKIITPAAMKAVLDNYVAASKLGVANGVATLGADGKLVLSQRPPIDLIDVWAVASQAAMLALAATPGDFAVRADSGLVYVLQAAPPTVLGNWLEISTPAPVSSVNGQVGTVMLSAADVGAPPVARTIAGTGLATGGGDLSANRAINVAIATAAEVLAGAIGNKAVTPASLALVLAQLTAAVPGARTVLGSGLVTGGGDLSANRTLDVAIASIAEIVAGVVNNKAITPAGIGGLPKSRTQNGFFTVPGGLIIQWVKYRQLITNEVQIPIAFPTTFPSAVFASVAMGYTDFYSNVRDLWPQILGEPDLGGCVIQTQSDDGVNMRIDGFDLILIGN